TNIVPRSFTHQREGVLLTLIKSRDPIIEITFSVASASADVEMEASFCAYKLHTIHTQTHSAADKP
ncbi:MAG: hypothetical protein K2I58_04685, partial [Candidatus Amulumruptor sp.]|nr:hypothetical protein [Candidatus Amulumruptor sp.]